MLYLYKSKFNFPQPDLSVKYNDDYKIEYNDDYKIKIFKMDALTHKITKEEYDFFKNHFYLKKYISFYEIPNTEKWHKMKKLFHKNKKKREKFLKKEFKQRLKYIREVVEFYKKRDFLIEMILKYYENKKILLYITNYVIGVCDTSYDFEKKYNFIHNLSAEEENIIIKEFKATKNKTKEIIKENIKHIMFDEFFVLEQLVILKNKYITIDL